MAEAAPAGDHLSPIAAEEKLQAQAQEDAALAALGFFVGPHHNSAPEVAVAQKAELLREQRLALVQQGQAQQQAQAWARA